MSGALISGSSAASTPTAGSARATTSAPYLLALGDSLAAGYQPTDGTTAPPVDPATGYADRGYPSSYASDLANERHLRLVDLACPGETTASMTTKPAIGQCTKLYKAEFGAPTQIASTKVFLARHQGQVGLVTLDLGANDIDGCISATGFNVLCLLSGQNAVTSELPAIVASIKAMLHVDDPSARFVAMNYYDPFLGVGYSPGGAKGIAAAALSVPATDTFDGHLASIYKHDDVPMANVATAFSTSKTLPLITYAGRRLPLDVADICRWTWMCPLPSSKSSPNIHANVVGYRVIAGAFEKVLAAT